MKHSDASKRVSSSLEQSARENDDEAWWELAVKQRLDPVTLATCPTDISEHSECVAAS